MPGLLYVLFCCIFTIKMKVMNNSYKLLIITVLAFGTARAQNGVFKIGIGYQRTWVVDKQASTLKYQSAEKTFLLGYSNSGAKHRFDAQLSGGFGKFFPTGFQNRLWYNPVYNADGSAKIDSSLVTGTLYNAKLDIAYSKNISNGYTKIGNNDFYSKRYAGASISNNLFYSDNITRNAWMNSTSLNALYQYTTLMNVKHQFSIRLTIPLVARNTRLAYHNTVASSTGDSHVKTFFKQGSRLVSFASFQNIRVDAGYDYAAGKNFGMGIHYSGQWLRYAYEKPISLFQNNIGVVVSIK